MVKFILNKKSLMTFGKWSLALFSLALLTVFFGQYVIQILAVAPPTIDTAVTVNLISPETGAYRAASTTNFTYNATATSSFALKNCTLWGNFTGNWVSNSSNATGVANNTVNGINIATIDGTYIWNVYCYNATSHGNYAAANYTVVVDNTNPVLNNTYPANNSFANSSSIVFNVSLTEYNIDYTKNVTLYYRRHIAGAEWQSQVLKCYGDSPSFTCNYTAIDISNIPVSVGNGESLEFLYNSTDAAGKVGTRGTMDSPLNVTLDTTVPTSPGVVYHTDDTPFDTYDNDTTLLFGWSAATDAVSGIKEYRIYVSWNGSAYAYNGTNSSATGYSFTGANNQNYSVKVLSVDNAGNVNSTGTISNVTVIVDTAQPSSPSGVTFESHPSTSYSNQTSLILNWTAATDATAILRYNIYVWDNENATGYALLGTNNSAIGYSFTGTTGRNYSINVTAVDVAGIENKTGSLSTTITVDTTEPASPTNVAFASDPTTSYDDDTTLILNWTAATDATSGIKEYKIYVSENGSSYAYNGTNNSATGYSFTGANNQNYSIRVTAKNNAWIENTTGATSSTTIIVDTTNPTSPTNVAFEADPTTSIDNDGTIIVNWTAATDANDILNYKIYIWDDENATGYAYAGMNDSKTGFSFTGTSAHNYSVNVTANDSAHNENTAGALSSTTITVDTTNPTAIYTVSPTLANGSYTSNTWIYVNVTFTETNPSKCILQWTNSTGRMNITANPANSNCYWNLTGQPEGEWNYSVIVNDTGGREGVNTTFNPFFVTVDLTNPIINETTPVNSGYFRNPTSMTFQVKLTEQNRDNAVNVTIYYRKQNVGSYQSSTMNCYGTTPSWTCNKTGINTGLLNGEVLEFFFNTTDLSGRAGTNGTQASPLTATVDTGAPAYSSNASNVTGIGKYDPIKLYANWTDADTMDSFLVEFVVSAGGAAWNVTQQSFSGGTWSNYSYPGNSTGNWVPGTQIQWKIYANDTAGNWNVTAPVNFSIDNTKPSYSNNDTNITSGSTIVKGTGIAVYALWTDNLQLHKGWAQENITTPGTMQNTSITISSNWTNASFPTASLTVGATYAVKLFVNDTSGNENLTEVQWYWKIDGNAPTYANQSDSASGEAMYRPGAIHYLNISWTDNLGNGNVSTVLLNFSGYSSNQTATSLGTSNYSFALTDLGFGNYTYRWYASDTSGNWNFTVVYQFNITRNTSNPINIYIRNSTAAYNNTNVTESAGVSITVNSTAVYGNGTELKLYRNGTQVDNPLTFTPSSAIVYNFTTDIAAANYTANTTGPGTFWLTISTDTIAPTVLLVDSTQAYAFDNSSAKKSGSTVTLNVSVADTGGITSSEECFVKVGSATEINFANYSGSSISGWCNGSFTVPSVSQGLNLMNITVNDTVNNIGSNATYYLTVDNASSIITITSPVNGTYRKVGSDGYIWINGTISDNLQLGSGNVSMNITSGYNFTVYNFTKVNNSEFSFRNQSTVADGYVVLRINYTDNATNTAEAVVYFYVDNTAPSAVVALKNSSSGRYRSNSAQGIEIRINDALKTNDTITLNYTKYNTSGSFEWTTVRLTGTPGTSTLYSGTIDTTNPYQIDGWVIQYYITGTDNATNTIALGGSSVVPLGNVTIDKYCGYNGSTLAYCSYSEGWQALSTGSINTFHEAHWSSYQLSGASSLSSNYNISNVLSSIDSKFSYVYYRNYSSTTTPWISYDPSIAWSLNTLRFGNNTDVLYLINVTSAGTVIRIA